MEEEMLSSGSGLELESCCDILDEEILSDSESELESCGDIVDEAIVVFL